MSKMKTFEENLQDLETIVNKLENGDVPLEEAISEFQKECFSQKNFKRPYKRQKNTRQSDAS